MHTLVSKYSAVKCPKFVKFLYGFAYRPIHTLHFMIVIKFTQIFKKQLMSDEKHD